MSDDQITSFYRKSHKPLPSTVWEQRLKEYARTGIWPSQQRPTYRNKKWHRKFRDITECQLTRKLQGLHYHERQKGCTCGYHGQVTSSRHDNWSQPSGLCHTAAPMDPSSAPHLHSSSSGTYAGSDIGLKYNVEPTSNGTPGNDEEPPINGDTDNDEETLSNGDPDSDEMSLNVASNNASPTQVDRQSPNESPSNEVSPMSIGDSQIVTPSKRTMNGMSPDEPAIEGSSPTSTEIPTSPAHTGQQITPQKKKRGWPKGVKRGVEFARKINIARVRNKLLRKRRLSAGSEKQKLSNRAVSLAAIHPYIICSLCKGYMVDPQTITECLHTFCKSCLVRHIMDTSLQCPCCKILIHPTDPFIYIRHDSQIQDIIYKLLPHIEIDERQRELAFYKARNLTPPLPGNKPRPTSSEHHYYVNIQLTPSPTSNTGLVKPLCKSYVRVLSSATVGNIHNYLVHKLQLAAHYQMSVLYNGISIDDRHTTLKSIQHCFGIDEGLIQLQYRLNRVNRTFSLG